MTDELKFPKSLETWKIGSFLVIGNLAPAPVHTLSFQKGDSNSPSLSWKPAKWKYYSGEGGRGRRTNDETMVIVE